MNENKRYAMLGFISLIIYIMGCLLLFKIGINTNSLILMIICLIILGVYYLLVWLGRVK